MDEVVTFTRIVPATETMFFIPSFPLSGATIDLWFTTNQYYDSDAGGSGQPVTNYLTCVRASVGNAKNSSGVWVPFGVNTLRITDLGLLTEDSRTNNLLNSGVPVTQTTASLATGSYTLWVEGSGSALASGGTATITGAASASQNNPNTFTVTVAGTVTVTVTGSLTLFQLEEGTFPSSYIITTGAAATRAADAVNCLGNLVTLLAVLPMTVVADVKTIAALTNTARILSTVIPVNSASLSVENTDNRLQWYNGFSAVITGVIGGGGLFTAGVKVAGSQDSTSRSAAANGSALGFPDAGPGTAFPTPGLGRSGNAGEALFGYIRRITFWTSKLADVTMQGFTAP